MGRKLLKYLTCLLVLLYGSIPVLSFANEIVNDQIKDIFSKQVPLDKDSLLIDSKERAYHQERFSDEDILFGKPMILASSQTTQEGIGYNAKRRGRNPCGLAVVLGGLIGLGAGEMFSIGQSETNSRLSALGGMLIGGFLGYLLEEP